MDNSPYVALFGPNGQLLPRATTPAPLVVDALVDKGIPSPVYRADSFSETAIGTFVDTFTVDGIAHDDVVLSYRSNDALLVNKAIDISSRVEVWSHPPGVPTQKLRTLFQPMASDISPTQVPRHLRLTGCRGTSVTVEFTTVITGTGAEPATIEWALQGKLASKAPEPPLSCYALADRIAPALNKYMVGITVGLRGLSEVNIRRIWFFNNNASGNLASALEHEISYAGGTIGGNTVTIQKVDPSFVTPAPTTINNARVLTNLSGSIVAGALIRRAFHMANTFTLTGDTAAAALANARDHQLLYDDVRDGGPIRLVSQTSGSSQTVTIRCITDPGVVSTHTCSYLIEMEINAL